MARSRPMAVGLLQVGTNASEASRRQRRVALAVHADQEGYALVETFEIDGRPVRDDSVLQALEGLASSLDVDALLTSGVIDRVRVEHLADRVRLLVREVAL